MSLGSECIDDNGAVARYIELQLAIERFRQLLSEPSQALLKPIQATVLRDVGVIIQMIERAGGEYAIQNDANISEICEDLSESIDDLPLDDNAKRVTTALIDEIGSYLDALENEEASSTHPHPVKMALSIARAEGRLNEVTSGVWSLLAEAEGNARIAKAFTEVKRAGGIARREQLKANAEAWKAAALPIAQKHDKRVRSRGALAMRVLGELHEIKDADFVKPADVDTIKKWLKNEVEPKHLVRSRSRGDSA